MSVEMICTHVLERMDDHAKVRKVSMAEVSRRKVVLTKD